MSNVTFLKKLFGAPDNSNPGKAPKSPPRPKAIAFVDYEHWYYSYQNLFGMRPDVESWRKELADEYEIEDIYVLENSGTKASTTNCLSYGP